MNLDSLKKQWELILQIAEKHGAYDVRVFGSVAKGEEAKDSDIDLLVKFYPGRSLFDLIEMKEDIPWRNMEGLRDVLMHEYFGVDLEIIWNVVEKELSQVKIKLMELT